jgi:hypothetical protein
VVNTHSALRHVKELVGCGDTITVASGSGQQGTMSGPL